jgi:hypothetical protein
MQIVLALLCMSVAAVVGGIAGQVLTDVGLGSGTSAKDLSLNMVPPAVLGAVFCAGVIYWIRNAKYRVWGEVLKMIIACAILLIAGATTGFGLWSLWRIHDVTGSSDPASDALATAASATAAQQYEPQLSRELVNTDKHLGLSMLKTALQQKPLQNMLVFPPGFAQIMHLDVALGDEATQKQIASAGGIAQFPEDLDRSDKAVRELIINSGPGVKTAWDMKIAIAPSGVSPSSKLRELAQKYGGAVETNSSLQHGQSSFKTTIDFNGRWKYEFDPIATKDGDFFTAAGSTERVKYLHQTFTDSSEIAVYDGNDVSLVVLPYKNNSQSCVLVMPKRQSLAEYIAALDGNKLDEITHGGNLSTGTLSCPKLTVESDEALTDIVKAMGITHMFDGSGNPLPKLSDSGNTYAVSIMQKAKLVLDEKGTKVLFSIEQLNQTNAYHAPPTPFNITIDHPFLLVIYDKRTDEPLFLGAIYHPR